MVSSHAIATHPDPLAGALDHIMGAAAHATALRHELHQHPELGYQEKLTAGVICRELARLGIEHQTGLAGGTGVLGIIRGQLPAGADAAPERCVALRADMDALPVEELTGLPYASQTKGCMHACGHDGHMAVLLGAAAVLKQAASHFRGTVKLLFQPAEEGGCGALRMVQDGVLENPRVDAIFGLHGWPGLK
ncbi:MAG: amidohydrolase, partial [Phycisphaerae bacterium]